MAAGHMGVEETGMPNKAQGCHTISLQVRIQTRDACGHCGANKKH